MNATTNNAATNNAKNDAIQAELAKIDDAIADAKRRVARAADTMLRRAHDAVSNAAAMLKDEPCSLIWVEFAVADQREAQEARTELAALYTQRKMLQHLLAT
jgi:hypothetical protein